MISLIRDYLDILSSTLNTSASSFEVIQVTLKFCLESLLSFCQYVLTFGWFRDVMYLPILLPKCQELLLSGRFFYEDLNLPFFEHLANIESKNNVLNLFALGFLNSLFCCLPFSTTHFFALRRLFVQGVIAGSASTLGILVGQCTFIFCTLFGIRWAIIPWLSLEPLSFFLGIYLIFTMVYEMSNEKRLRSVDISEKPLLRQIFFLSALLTWTEEATLSQYFTNITLTNQPSIFTLGGTGTFATNMSYFVGILLGHLFFSACLIGLSLMVKNALFSVSKLPYSTWLKQANNLFLVGILALSLSSMPYYSLDYLLTGPLGFLSQDKLLEQSIFTQKNTKDPSRLLTSMDVVFPFAIDTDIAYFDRANYGDQPGFFKRNFEQLNYQGEYAWLVRRDKKPNLYSSGQTTETTIRDLFKLNQNETQTNEEKTKAGIEARKNKGNTSLPIDSASAKANEAQIQELAQLAAEERVMPKVRTTDRDLLKLRKRFNENYEETRLRDTYLIGESFNNIPTMDISLTPLEVSLKQKFYTNLVYKTLLNIEIDAFLKRQPDSFLLNQQQEKEIYKKRIALARYYDTIRAYQQIPYKEEFNSLFRGSKTFVDRAYNHQFKGTLGVVRRLFAVTLDNDENPTQKAVLKLDQPLALTNKQKDLFTHEELQETQQKQNQNWILNYTNLPSFNETNTQTQTKPFLEINDSTPFYLGWDNQERKMILTKRFNPNSNSIHIQNEGNKNNNQAFIQNLKNNKQQEQEPLIFTTWPLQKQALMTLKAKSTNPVVTMFEPTSNPDVMAIYKLTSGNKSKSATAAILNEDNVEVFCFPANIRYLNKIPEHLVPNQGGFVWPGSQYKYRTNEIQQNK